MILDDDALKALLHELKAGLQATYGARLAGVYLYGSYARGEQNDESDIDILIVLDRIERYAAEIEHTGQLISELSLQCGVSISRVFIEARAWVHGDTAFLVDARSEAVPT